MDGHRPLYDAAETDDAIGLPEPPKMRIVTQGWWVYREREVTREELRAFEAAEEERRNRGWFWWLGRRTKQPPAG